MTDRTTEPLDLPDASGGFGASGTNTPLFDETASDEFANGSETVTRSAAVEERSSLGQTVTVGGDEDTTKKDHAQAVAQDAKESTKNVASTAASEAKDVANTARTQIRSLVDQLGGEASEQASGQTQRAVQGLRSLGGELSDMAEGKQGQSGMASDLARQGASRLDSAANWLEGRQPGEILDEVRSFARRRPGAFIAGAALLGLIGGRMTRGLTADSSSNDSSVAPSAAPRSTSATPAAAYPGGAAYVSETPVVTSAGVGTGTGYVEPSFQPVGQGEPVDLEGTDPTRVDAGIDPTTYTHPSSTSGVTGDTR